jgi:hypothetical protein
MANLVRASATKSIATTLAPSRVELWEVDADVNPDGRWFLGTPVGSTATKAWKTSLRNGLARADVAEEMPGALLLEIAFRCSTRRRNWVNLWKPAGDALGPLIGEPDPRNPFNPADDRVVELAMHLDAADAMGNDVRVAVRCEPASPL